METIILDDGIEYVVIDEKTINDTLYTLFANINDSTDICFRKTVAEEDGEEYYVGLDDEKEFNLVTMHFSKDILK